MSGLSEAFKSHLDSESWDAIAQMALGFQIELSREDKETHRLRKELTMVKHILYESIRTPESAHKLVNAAFFVRLYKDVARFEKTFDKHKIERIGFLMFLQAVLGKLRKERLVVHKPIERKNEFKMMKDVGLL